MDSNVSMDDMNDTAPLPELSFDDLLDISPVKKKSSLSNSDDYVMEETNDVSNNVDNVLNTPVVRKIQNHPERTSAPSTISTIKPKSNAEPIEIKSNIFIPKDSSANNGNKTISSPSVVLNSKNIITKPSTAGTSPSIVKIISKSAATTTSTNSTSTTSAITPITIAGKTAIKTASGKVIYIQKSFSGQIPSVRLQAGSSVKTVTVSSPGSNATSQSKPLAIQVMRAADGSFVPVKTVSPITSATTSPKINTIKITSSSLANNVVAGGKKVLTTSGGQVLIKAPLTPISGAAVAAIQKASSINPTAEKETKTSNETKTKTSNGSENNEALQKETKKPSTTIISMSPGPLVSSSPAVTSSTTTVVGNTTITKTLSSPSTSKVVTTTLSTNPISKTTISNASVVSSAGVKQNIVVKTANGKPIIVPNQNIIKLSPKVVSNSGSISIKGSIQTANAGQLRAIQIPGKPGKQWVRVLPQSKITTSSSSSAGGSSSAALSSVATKLPTVATTKVINSTLSQAGVSLKNLNSVPQKFTIVRPVNNSKIVLTQSPKLDGSKTTTVVSKILPASSNVLSASSTTATVTSANGGSQVIEKSTKISEINSEIRRIIGGGGLREINSLQVKKIDTKGKRIVLMPVSKSGGQLQRASTAQSAVKNEDQDSKILPKVVLKNTSSIEDVRAQIKSYLICGKAKALMMEKQQKNPPPPSVKKESPIEISLDKLVLNTAVPKTLETEILPEDNMIVEPDIDIDKKPENFEDIPGTVRRKHCNCSKSQCLKLYCDCFANGEFCKDCTCKDCFNNLEYEDERQRAIRICLERNPSAFKPKITTASDYGDTRLHNKGCNCKRSGCLKNYCECYEAKIACSSNCKCVGCRNVDDRPDLDMDPHQDSENVNQTVKIEGATNYRKRELDYPRQGKDKIKSENGIGGNLMDGQLPEKRPCNIITQEVFEATIQCMISQADECEKKTDPPFDYITKEHMVIKEVGRCLEEILNFSINNSDISFSQE